jgi:hypothetical protein
VLAPFDDLATPVFLKEHMAAPAVFPESPSLARYAADEDFALL